MKKILSLALMLCMLVSVVAPTLVFAEPEATNLAAGKEVLNAAVNGQNGNYCADMTDGVIADAISTENGVWFGYWYNGDATPDLIEKYSNTDENGIAIPTIDLGGSYELSSARIHIVDEASWGICAPTSIVAQISDDGETFKDVATVTEFASGVTWVDFDLGGVTAQYVRLAIDLSTSWFFLDEIEIYGVGAAGGDVEAPAIQPDVLDELPDGALTLDYAGYMHAGVHSIVAGDGMTVSELTALGNDGAAKDMNYAFIIVVDADGIVTRTWYELSVSKADVVCPEGGYIISFNGNKAGYADLAAIKEGATITLYNLNVDAFRGAEGNVELTGAGFTYENPADDTPVVPAPEVPENAEMFWVTHYNNNTVEGSGVIFTEPYEGAAWWLHVAFAPIEGVENGYEIVDMNDGTAVGNGVALAIPEGGFVWASNTGNDYISLGIGDTDFTSPNCNGALERARAWAIGDQFVIYGVDFETIPTSTPSLNWYDDAYVCTAYIAPYGEEPTPDVPDVPEPPVVIGGNLVAGLQYVISEQFHMGGADVGWGWDDNAPASYPDVNFELTDGQWPAAEDGYAADGWMAFNQQTPAQKDRGYAYVRFDLGAATDLSVAKIVTWKDIPTGIQPAHTIEVWTSADGETYELAGEYKPDSDTHTALEDLTVHTLEIDLEATAQYVEFRFISYGWCFLGEIELYGVGGGSDTPDVPVIPDEDKTYENTMTIDPGTGNASVEVPYGFTWNVNYIDGKIVGEDVTIVTTQDAYNACNPNWAITLYLEKQADGTYVALRDAIVTPGSAAAAGITIGENQIALVVHSSSSNPEAGYANWLGKIVALSVKAGDVFVVDMDAMTVYAPKPGEDIVLPEPPVVEPEGVEVVLETIVNDDNTVTVIVSFANVADNLTGFSAKLFYDANVLNVLNSIDSENALECIKSFPSDSWENLTSLKDGYIDLKVCVTTEFAPITADNLVFEFTFGVNAGYKTAAIEISDAKFLDSDLNYVNGTGAYAEIELPEIEVPEEPTNVVLGKDWTGDTNIGTSYVGSLTDGVIDPNGAYDNTLWYGTDKRLDDNDAFTMIFELGDLYNVSETRIHVWPLGASGIVVPASIDFYASEDSETFTLIGSVTSFDGTAPQWVSVSSDVNAKYIRIDMVSAVEGDTGVFWFASEVEVYGVPATAEPEPPVDPEVPTGSESLIPGEGANWIKTDHGSASVDVIYNEDGSVTFTGSELWTWPSVETWYIDTPIIADTLDDYLSIDFTVVGGTTNINFFFDDGNGGSVSFSISNTALNAACPGANIDTGSGDLYDGVYKCNIPIKDLIAATMNLGGKAFPEAAIIDGTIKFIGINVYSVNGATITVNDLSVVHVSEEEPEPPVSEGIVIDGEINENAYDNAFWFDKGVWQSIKETDPILADLDIAYTTLADAENIYLAIRVNKGVDFKTALNPDAWDQSGATNFRLWFKGDGMESRTFFDLLWNGEEFAPFLAKVPTDTLTYAATYGDDYIVMEVKIAKETLSISESFEMMVTFSTPYCGEGDNVGYNAFHMTSFERGEDGALPSGWSGNTSMYETYNVADIEINTVVLGDVNGDGKIDGKDATKLLQYLANYNYADGTCDVVISAGADVTGDGIVDGRDSIRLLKYLANLDPATGSSNVVLG